MNENTNKTGQPRETGGVMYEPACESRPPSASDAHRHEAPPMGPEQGWTFAPNSVDAQRAATAETEAVAPEPMGTASPSGELPPAESELFERARAAVAALRGRGRQPNGQAGLGNTLRLTTGLRSHQLVEQPDIAAWHREQVQIITADLGGASELAGLKRAAVREAARLEVISAALGDDVMRVGVLTGKGKTRAATRTYLAVLDRFMRLADMLGLERKPKHLTLAELLASQPSHDASSDDRAPEN